MYKRPKRNLVGNGLIHDFILIINNKSILLIKNNVNRFIFSHYHLHPQCDVNSQAMPLWQQNLPGLSKFHDNTLHKQQDNNLHIKTLLSFYSSYFIHCWTWYARKEPMGATNFYIAMTFDEAAPRHQTSNPWWLALIKLIAFIAIPPENGIINIIRLPINISE